MNAGSIPARASTIFRHLQNLLFPNIDINISGFITTGMSDRVSVYDAWCDGSYREAQKRGGAAWVIRHDGQISEGSVMLPTLHKTARPHGSDIAEVTAVLHALRAIPLGSVVRLRLDCQNVMDWLNAGALSRKKVDIVPLQDTFAQTHALMTSMKRVDIIKVSGINNEHHGRAHVLSRAVVHTPK